MNYDALNDVIAVSERLVSALVAQTDERLLVGLHRFLELLRSDPLLSAAVSSLAAQAREQEEAFGRHDRSLRCELCETWPRYRALAESIEVEPDKKDVFNALGSLEAFERRLKEPAIIEFPDLDEPDSDPSTSKKLLKQLHHWLEWKRPKLATDDPEFDELERLFWHFQERHTSAFRRFWLDGRNLAGVALKRLQALAAAMNPSPGAPDLDARVLTWIASRSVRELCKAVYEGASGGEAETAVAKAAGAVRRDLKLVQEEVSAVLVLRRSRLSLVRRFAARCERYDADELRTIARDSKAERELTSRFAKFLFDAGLNPLTDTPIAGLKPDVLEMGAPFYVEAKQYGGQVVKPGGRKVGVRRGPAPSAVRTTLRKAFWQVLDTWGRLRGTLSLPEAFLLIFRLGGPRVEIPNVIQLDGRLLYVWVVDLGPADQSGARQGLTPVVVAVDEVVSWSSSGSKGVAPHASRRRYARVQVSPRPRTVVAVRPRAGR